MSFLHLLAFFLRLRFIIRFSGKPGRWIWLIFGILYVVSQAVIAIYILDFGDNSWASRSIVVSVINFVLMSLLIAVHFFPTYQATSMPIWSFHPVKQWQRGLFAFASHTSHASLVFLVLFSVTFFVVTINLRVFVFAFLKPDVPDLIKENIFIQSTVLMYL